MSLWESTQKVRSPYEHTGVGLNDTPITGEGVQVRYRLDVDRDEKFGLRCVFSLLGSLLREVKVGLIVPCT